MVHITIEQTYSQIMHPNRLKAMYPFFHRIMFRPLLLAILALFLAHQVDATNHTRIVGAPCVSFTVSQGTGCAWMCTYCANQLGTNNYYFTDGVCTYQTGGCAGNPNVGQVYTCCAA